jgi:hypothetical protein
VANECSIALPNTHSHILGNFNRELPDDILRPGFPTVELLERIYEPLNTLTRPAPSHQLFDGRMVWRLDERLYASRNVQYEECVVGSGKLLITFSLA